MTTYFIDSSGGSDRNEGLGEGSAWRTLSHAFKNEFRPGDRILLRKGSAWNEPVRLRGRGSPANPLFLGTWGEGPRPLINGGEAHAISAPEPVSGWHICGLELTSTNSRNPGREIRGGTCGIFLSQEEPSESLVVEDCLIHDTSGPGIFLVAGGPPAPVFAGVRVENCEVHHASAGIHFRAEPLTPDYFPGFRVAHCTVHETGGDGITPWCGTGGVVEHCKAFRTGLGVGEKDYSPVGIWYAFARDCIIQHCESYENHPGGKKADGGGFDVDGGATGCILQYNYSHDNDGAGFLLCSFDPVKWPTVDCTCRYNLSVNDGLANGFSSIFFWQAQRCSAYNNTCITRTTPGLKFISETRDNLIANNIFFNESGEDVPLLQSEFKLAENRFFNNIYGRLGGAPRFEILKESLADPARLMELTGGRNELAMDPLLAGIKSGNYRLGQDSPGRGSGLVIPGQGDRDYFGVPLASGERPDRGYARFV